MDALHWVYLGRVEYRRGLDLQARVRQDVLSGACGHTLLLLHHPHVITLGRRGRMEDVLLEAVDRARLGVAVVKTDRGGEATYHGPGQLVGYPIVDLKRLGLGSRALVLRLCGALQETLAAYGVEARWNESNPGLWCAAGKVVAVGLNVHHGVTTHGFSMNVATDLSAFSWIVPCGQPGARAASILSITGRSPDLADVAETAAGRLSAALGLVPMPASDPS